MPEFCKIRPLNTKDLQLILSWRNHPNVRNFMITQHEITLKEHQNWFDKFNQDSTRSLLIVEELNTPIGYVQFSGISVGGVADWGFYARPYSPKGTGRKIGTIALNHAFNELKLHKICGQALDFNESSIDFHQRLGFYKEGILRDQHKIDGVYHDLIFFGLIRHEWHPK
jgi:UDP-4-amino-4,6-dideoxy-N-acetyl-beta-L-altrosamine N-acetyltransferase